MKSVRPQVSAACRRIEKFPILFGLLSFGSVILFIMTIALLSAMGERTTRPRPGWETHYNTFGANAGNSITTLTPAMQYLPTLILGVVGFFVFLVLAIVLAVRVHRLCALRTLVREISSVDKVAFDNLSIRRSVYSLSNATTAAVVKKLIDTRNLDGYEVIGELGVAKISFHARESDFPKPQSAVANTANAIGKAVGNITREFTSGFNNTPAPQKEEAKPKNHRCPSCGSAITTASNRFCEFCRTRLE